MISSTFTAFVSKIAMDFLSWNHLSLFHVSMLLHGCSCFLYLFGLTPPGWVLWALFLLSSCSSESCSDWSFPKVDRGEQFNIAPTQPWGGVRAGETHQVRSAVWMSVMAQPPAPWRWSCTHWGQKAVALLLMMGFLFSLPLWGLLNLYLGLMRRLLHLSMGLYLLALRLILFYLFLSLVWKIRCQFMLNLPSWKKVQVQILPSGTGR